MLRLRKCVKMKNNLLTGHHEVPEETNNRISPAFGIADKSGSIILPDINPDKDVIKPNITTTENPGIYQYMDVKIVSTALAFVITVLMAFYLFTRVSLFIVKFVMKIESDTI